jgi:hypothetical protein
MFMRFLILLLFSSSLYAYEFKHIRFNEQYRKKNSNERAFVAKSGPRSGERVSRSNLRLLQLRNNVSRSVLKMNQVDDSTPPLLQRIKDAIGERYNQIGEDQTRDLLINREIGGGVLNFSGFSWQKPLVNVGLDVNREVAPTLFGDEWLVHDTLYIVINAQTFLGQLSDDGIIDMTESEIGAFAGISLVREYKYTHVADSYMNGLTSDFSKLFLSFTKFNANHVLSMPEYEFMSREDKYTFNAGGFVNSPPINGISLRAGVLVNVGYTNKLTIQSLGENDNPKGDEFLRISIDKEVNRGADFHLSLQADFFHLLQITILSMDLAYEFASANKTYLSIYERDRETFANSSVHWDEFSGLVSSRTQNVNFLRDNVVSLEQRTRENFSSKFAFLLVGDIKKRETEQIRVIKEGVEKVFFKHYSESLRYIQNFFSKIFNKIVYKLFNWDVGISNAAESKKRMTLEFESIDAFNQPGSVENEESFSLEFKMNFKAAKTHKWNHKLYRKETIKHLSRLTNLTDNYANLVSKKKLRGPLAIESKILVETQGLRYFNSLSEDEIFEIIQAVCRNDNSKWSTEDQRRKQLKKVQVGSNGCVKLLGKKYLKYLHEKLMTGRMDLFKLKAFLGSYFKRVRHYSEFFWLFGQDNTFMTGEFNANTDQGQTFTTYFNQGDFRGLGIIDRFMRQGVSRSPTQIDTK